MSKINPKNIWELKEKIMNDKKDYCKGNCKGKVKKYCKDCYFSYVGITDNGIFCTYPSKVNIDDAVVGSPLCRLVNPDNDCNNYVSQAYFESQIVNANHKISQAWQGTKVNSDEFRVKLNAAITKLFNLSISLTKASIAIQDFAKIVSEINDDKE